MQDFCEIYKSKTHYIFRETGGRWVITEKVKDNLKFTRLHEESNFKNNMINEFLSIKTCNFSKRRNKEIEI